VTTEWDAGSYERVSEPQVEWGRAVLARIPLRGDEDVLDAGCGTGRVTRLIAERVPRGNVVGVDASAAMGDEAARRLADLAPRVRVRRADLLELELDAPVDAVISTATFHWIRDHDTLFTRLRAALKPGGRLVAQCGGAGNIASIQRVLATTGDGWLGAVHFETVLDTARRLDAAGFVDIECWLTDAPTWFEAGEPFETYLRTVVLGAHLEGLPPSEHEDFVRAVAAGLDEPMIDYVRLNITAGRSSR
jgi:trans-aconitate 2-methyltransferase